MLHGWDWGASVGDGRHVSDGGAWFVALEDVRLLRHLLRHMKVNPKPVLFGKYAARNVQR